MDQFSSSIEQADRYGTQIMYLLEHNRIKEAYKIQDAANDFLKQFDGRLRALLRREIGIDAYRRL